jgi:DNA-directed RNA polymerase beta subunit
MTNGPVNMITKQPLNGKNNKGGLRLGELDKDCLLAHGSMSILQEKFINHSDKYKMYYCKNCCNISIEKNICIYCKENILDYINTTYSFKVLCDMLKGLNINTLLYKN